MRTWNSDHTEPLSSPARAPRPHAAAALTAGSPPVPILLEGTSGDGRATVSILGSGTQGSHSDPDPRGRSKIRHQTHGRFLQGAKILLFFWGLFFGLKPQWSLRWSLRVSKPAARGGLTLKEETFLLVIQQVGYLYIYTHTE